MHEEHCAAVALSQQCPQCVGVALHRRVADDVDGVCTRPAWWQNRVELGAQAVAQVAQRYASERRRVGRHDAGTAAVGHQRQRLVAVARKAGQRLSGHEQILQGVHAQHPRTPDGGVEHDVRAGQRAGV